MNLFKSLTIAAGILWAGTALAASPESRLDRMAYPSDSSASQAVTIGAFLSSYSMTMTGTVTELGNSMNGSGSGDVGSNLGLSIGYVNAPSTSVGYMFKASIFDVVVEEFGIGKDIDVTRFEANATYGVDSNSFFYGGVNLGNYDGLIGGFFDGGLGFQAGYTYRISNVLNFDLAYSINNSDLNFNDGFGNATDVDIDISGIEIGVSATF